MAGLPYTYRFLSLPIIVQTRDGISFGDMQRIAEVFLRLLRSLGGRVGGGDPESIQTRPIAYRRVDHPIGSAPPLFSGLLGGPVIGQAALDLSVEVNGGGPLAFELSAIGAILDSSSS